MTTLKTQCFPVDVLWTGGPVTEVTAAGKPELRVATPPEFRGGVEGVWSPEHLVVAAVASCYVTTLVSIAERRDVPLDAVEVRGAGYMTLRPDGRFGFIAVDLEVSLQTKPGREDHVRSIARDAEHACLVAASLDLPVRVALEVSASPVAA
jgi:organic hydroperoxide reductase OsmC/OhrA